MNRSPWREAVEPTRYRGFAAALCLVVALPIAGPAAAEITALTVDGDTLSAVLAFPGGVEADLSIEFERAVGLSVSSLGLSAELVDPTALASRFSNPSLVAAAAGLPVLITVEPPASGPLSFSGIVAVHLHTHNLAFVADSPLRLFSAPLGGRFVDVTEWMGMGSYRVRGSKGGFSEFLVVADLRPVDDVIEVKLDALQAVLDSHVAQIPEPVWSQIQEGIDATRWEWELGETAAAVEAAEALESYVASQSGSAIPDVWRSARDLSNAAGELRAAARTLRFSLSLKANAEI